MTHLTGGDGLAGLAAGNAAQDPEVLQQQEETHHSRLPPIQMTAGSGCANFGEGKEVSYKQDTNYPADG